jgi:excinuclease ABC subunit C
METPKEINKTISPEPGVYLFKDSTGVVIYVGKAKNLRRRVRQYFDGSHDVESKTAHLVSNIAHIETIETHSEFDALMLERN